MPLSFDESMRIMKYWLSSLLDLHLLGFQNISGPASLAQMVSLMGGSAAAAAPASLQQLPLAAVAPCGAGQLATLPLVTLPIPAAATLQLPTAAPAAVQGHVQHLTSLPVAGRVSQQPLSGPGPAILQQQQPAPSAATTAAPNNFQQLVPATVVPASFSQLVPTAVPGDLKQTIPLAVPTAVSVCVKDLDSLPLLPHVAKNGPGVADSSAVAVSPALSTPSSFSMAVSSAGLKAVSAILASPEGKRPSRVADSGGPYTVSGTGEAEAGSKVSPLSVDGPGWSTGMLSYCI